MMEKITEWWGLLLLWAILAMLCIIPLHLLHSMLHAFF